MRKKVGWTAEALLSQGSVTLRRRIRLVPLAPAASATRPSPFYELEFASGRERLTGRRTTLSNDLPKSDWCLACRITDLVLAQGRLRSYAVWRQRGIVDPENKP
jgi:hypothetical protein